MIDAAGRALADDVVVPDRCAHAPALSGSFLLSGFFRNDYVHCCSCFFFARAVGGSRRSRCRASNAPPGGLRRFARHPAYCVALILTLILTLFLTLILTLFLPDDASTNL
jgi:hypothetical protein